jgi:hypothetical protein
MSQNQPPQIAVEYDQLPQDAKARHEMLVDVLGQYVLWLRNWSIDSSRKVIATADANERLGTVRWKRYEGVAAMPPEQQQAALQLAEATVDRFVQLFLTLLSGTGVDQRIGNDHAVRFKLDLEIVDVETENIVETATVNRGGQKFFADYWGRWLNRFSSMKSPNDSTISPVD